MICVSKCLLGEPCRYDGQSKKNEKVIEYLKDKEYVTICPECLGGLPTPRTPSEIKNNKVISKDMQDVTLQFQKGAQEALKIAQNNHCEIAILQENSPSCGSHYIYDGTFSKKKIAGKGITAQLFEENNIQIMSSTDF